MIFQIYTIEGGFVCCLSKSSVKVDMYVVLDILFSKHAFDSFIHPYPYPTSKGGGYLYFV